MIKSSDVIGHLTDRSSGATVDAPLFSPQTHNFRGISLCIGHLSINIHVSEHEHCACVRDCFVVVVLHGMVLCLYLLSPSVGLPSSLVDKCVKLCVKKMRGNNIPKHDQEQKTQLYA